VNFSTPIAITANALYVASYFSTNGHFSVTNDYFAASGTTNGFLTAPANGGGILNGPFTYGASSAFPRNTYRSSNYWVDVAFTPSGGAVSPPPPPPAPAPSPSPAPVAANCTLYASASGNDGSSGTSVLAPKTFQGAANAAQPGDVICVKGGTYN